MSDRDPLLLILVLMVSIAATTLGINNLIWFVQRVEPPSHSPNMRF